MQDGTQGSNNTNGTEQEEGYSLDKVVEYVKQYMVYEEEKKLIAEAQRDFSKEFFIENPSIPKKEMTAAISAAKKKLDFDVVSEIYDEICTVMGVSGE